VFLPASVLLRRADPVTVIGWALLAKAGGAGHPRNAGQLGLPASTGAGAGSVASYAGQVLGCR